jgi:hypothetical protein
MLSFRCRVCQGDPFGSREAGTMKVLAEPRLATVEGQPFEFKTGGEVPVADGTAGLQLAFVGRTVRGTVKRGEGGKLSLDLTLETSDVIERADRFTRVEKHSTRILCAANLGEMVKLRWEKGKGQTQVWVELTVEEITVDWGQGISPGIEFRY